MTFSFEHRARQKAAARERDEERLASGEVTGAELQCENCHFSFLREKDRWFTFIPAVRSKDKHRVIKVPARKPSGEVDRD